MLENETISEIWESELSIKAINTQKKYRYHFNSFLARWETTPEELFETKLSDMNSNDPLRFRRMEKMVETQMSEMVRGGKAPGTAKQLKKAVSCFFEAVNMPLRVKVKNTPNGEVMGQKMMRADLQRELIAGLNRLNRKRNTAILLTGKDSGLRIGDIQRLTIEAYERAETIFNEIGEPFKKFDRKITQKCKVIAHIHLGPESIIAIDEYLEERRERGLIADKPTLFINKSRNAFKNDTMGSMISHQCTLAGARFKKQSSHSLRKFHRTMLQKARMPDAWIDKLQGKIPDTYSRPEEGGAPEETGDLTQAYIDCYAHLRIYKLPEELKAKNREIEVLKRENTELLKAIPGLVQEMTTMRAELKQLKAERERERRG